MNKKYVSLLTFLTQVKQSLQIKQQKLEEISMDEVRQMWDLMGSNGETIQMDLSWVASKEDIKNVIKSIDNISNLLYEKDYAELAAADWETTSASLGYKRLTKYRSNSKNIIIPGKIIIDNTPYPVCIGDKSNYGNKVEYIGIENVTETITILSNVKYEESLTLYATKSITGLGNLSKFNDDSYKYAKHEIYGSEITELDFTGYDFRNIDNLNYSWINCPKLTKLIISSFNREKIDNSNFFNDTKTRSPLLSEITYVD